MNDRAHRAVGIGGTLRLNASARPGFRQCVRTLCLDGQAPRSRGRVAGTRRVDGRAPQSRGRVPGSASLRRSTLRVDCPALLAARSRRGTRFAHFVRCAQTAATSQMTKRALRARRPPGCAARRRRGAPPATRPRLCAEPAVRTVDGFARTRCPSCRESTAVRRRGAGGRRAQRLCGAEQRRPVVGACAARASSSDSLRLSERSERSERSEFRNATTGRAAQGSRRAAATAAVKRSLPTARSSARAQHNKSLPASRSSALARCTRSLPTGRNSALAYCRT